jgi:hypothetical protein
MSLVSKTLANTETNAPPAERTAALRTRIALVGFVIALVLVTGVPYVYGYISAPEGREFQGIVFNVPDTVQYWSWMRDHHTALMVPNRMTPEANDPALFNMLWLGLGRIQVVTGWNEATINQLLRVVGGGGFLFVLWWFVGLLVIDRRARWTAYLIATLGGGLGWIWVVDKYINRLSDVRFPLDLYVVEPNTFFALLTLPHFLVAAALLLITFGTFLIAERRNDDWHYYGLSTLFALLLGLQHAYDLLIIYFVLGVYVLLQFIQARRILWGRFWGLAAVGFLSFPPAGYFTYITTHNPLWREVLAQFDNAGVFTPNLLHINILLGIPFIITLIYGVQRLVKLTRRGNTTAHAQSADAQSTILNSHLVWVWAIIGFALLYIPADFQIHMLNPYQVPIALLATQALWRWTAGRQTTTDDRRPSNRPNWRMIFSSRQTMIVLFILAVLPTNLYLWSWRMIDLRRAEPPFYLSTDEVKTLQWLDANDAESLVVFSGMEVGQYVPALTGHRAFLSHWAQTINFFGKRDAVKIFFDAATPIEQRHAMLEKYDVRYVVYGPEERAFGGFNPADDPLLREVFTTPQVTVFEVVN